MKRLGLSVTEPPPKKWSGDAGRAAAAGRLRKAPACAARGPSTSGSGSEARERWRDARRGAFRNLSAAVVADRRVFFAVSIVEPGLDGVELALPVLLGEFPPAAAELQQHLGGRVVVELDDGAPLLVGEQRLDEHVAQAGERIHAGFLQTR